MAEEKYPEELIRGIANKDFISEEGYVLPAAFQFEKTAREDGYCELSVNWNDDYGAILEAMNKRKENNGKLQFSIGITKMERRRMEFYLKDHIETKRLSYERKPVVNNDYHGNLLIHKNTSSQVRNLIMNGLSLTAGRNIIPQTNEI